MFLVYKINDFVVLKNDPNKIVFVIKEEFFELFKTSIGNRIEKLISIDYVFQGCYRTRHSQTTAYSRS